MLKRIEQAFFTFLFPKVSKFFYLRNAGAERREWLCYRYFLKKKKWFDLEWPELVIPREIPVGVKLNQTIFIYWKQGVENAPPLVKKCVQSVKENAMDFKVLVITEKNIKDYSDLPDFVEKQYKRGIISEALFSDILRSNLLYRFGGIWCDATCFWTKGVFEFIRDSDLFFFKASLLRKISLIEGSSWFIRAKQGDLILKKTQSFLFEWFRERDFVPYYFMFHLAISILVNEDETCKKKWEAIPYICNMNPHVFFFHFAKEYEETNYKRILESCFIHKLSYKFNPDLMNADKKNMLMHFLEEKSDGSF